MTEQEFERVARVYGNMIYRVACHAVGSRTDAEDVTQTVLLRLYEYAGTFQSEEHQKHWLLRVAVNESRKELRSLWRRRTVPLDEEWDAPAPERTDRTEVLQAVMALERKYRLTICLYYYEGCSVKEIAQLLKARPSTVQTWLQRARNKLRIALSDEEEPDYVRP